MGDPTPQKRGIGRWIFLGCAGCGGLVLLGMAGCAGFFYYLYKGTDAVAAVGAAYLRTSPGVSEALGSPLTVDRRPMDWSVQLRDDQGQARIGYNLAGPKGSAEAAVWLAKTAGVWAATGARVKREGETLTEIGDPPRPRVEWDD